MEIYPGFAAAELLIEDGRVVGVATGDMGVDEVRRARPQLPARHGAARALHAVRRGLPRQPDQAADGALRPARRAATRRPTRSASRSCGRCRPRSHRPGLIEHTIGWPLDRDTYGGSLAVSLRRQPGVVRLRGRAGLPQSRGCRRSTRCSGSRPIRRCARISRAARRHQLRRAGAERGRLPVDPEADLPRRRADRRHGRVPERAEDQGHACGDEVRHAGGRGGGRGAGRRPAGRAARAIETRFRASWLCDELRGRAQHPPGLRQVRPAMAASPIRRVDTYVLRGRAPWTLRAPACRQRDACCRRREAPRIDYPEAGRHADLRPAVLGVHQQHQPRGGPAGAPAPARPGALASR